MRAGGVWRGEHVQSARLGCDIVEEGENISEGGLEPPRSGWWIVGDGGGGKGAMACSCISQRSIAAVRGADGSQW